MKIKNIILSRFVFFSLVIFAILYYQVFVKVNIGDFLERIDLFTVFALLAMYILVLDIAKNLKLLRKRNSFLKEPLLQTAGENIEVPKRFNFLDKDVILREESIDVRSHGSLVLHLDKKKKLLEIRIRNDFRRKTIHFEEIDYIFLEYDQFQSYVPRILLGVTTGNDKTNFKNSVFAKLKNGREIKIFQAALKYSDLEANEDYLQTGTYKDRKYLSTGEKLIRLFCNYMGKNYAIVDND